MHQIIHFKFFYIGKKFCECFGSDFMLCFYVRDGKQIVNMISYMQDSVHNYTNATACLRNCIESCNSEIKWSGFHLETWRIHDIADEMRIAMERNIGESVPDGVTLTCRPGMSEHISRLPRLYCDACNWIPIVLRPHGALLHHRVLDFFHIVYCLWLTYSFTAIFLPVVTIVLVTFLIHQRNYCTVHLITLCYEGKYGYDFLKK